ncbi:hypothetical protein [Curtobacterium sp. S6]|uniref:hypothetical protein n=1 Tax=Curtobacterium sp. S6 TaxID=1479623 RepID=UPI0004AAE0A5|nr:hypothetical protein [Curtobacterium sp. S6]
MPITVAASGVPTYATSRPTKDRCTPFGVIVAAPWFSSWPAQGNFTGQSAKDLEWAVYPTSNCTEQPQSFGFTNSFPKVQAANPLATSGARNGMWPPVYPAGGNPDADYSSVDGVNGTGQGQQIRVLVENIAGEVNYRPTPTGNDRYIFQNGQGAYTSNGTRGQGANVPMIRLNDDFKGTNSPYSRLFGYLKFPGAPEPSKSTPWTWAYGEHSTNAAGRDQWTWTIELASNITTGQAGASVVSFMTRMPAATFGDENRASGAVIRTQYRVAVTSPWGTVTYTSDAV